MKKAIPLVVDLDGTLIRSDLLLESFYAMIKANFLSIVWVPFWFLYGKAYLKLQIAQRSHIDVKTLPYQSDFLDYLRHQHSKGTPIVLATASARKFADMIAKYLGIFSEVYATDGKMNISGKNKLKILLERYGEKGFDYAGNGRPDLEIFPHARNTILVNPSPTVPQAAQKTAHVEQIFDNRKTDPRTYLKAIRVHQWIKNILLFVPLLTSHQWNNPVLIVNLVLGFISLSLCASGVYLLNDLLDLNADRSHIRKKTRPLASGELSVWSGSAWMLFLQAVGLWLASTLNIQFFILMVLYCAITLSYTFLLKTYVLIDVLVLAGLYTLRVVAGCVLADAPLSFWLFAFSIFVFFSLALVKRCSELINLAKNKTEYAAGRDYNVSDIEYLREMGIASGYMAILIFALYINSPSVSEHYSHPQVLWMICPALFYWVSRIWLKTGRGEMADDPIVFSIKDRGSQFVAVCMLIIILLAI
jgi:4-hydroxybenzoate polyprenyltransferase